jgi:transposase-like protein
MLFENVNELLGPGYSALETGFTRLPNGQMYIAVLTRMPECNIRWLDWWFKNYDQMNYIKRSANTASIDRFHQTKGGMAQNYIYEHNDRYVKDMKSSGLTFKLVEPATYLDASKLKTSKMLIECVDVYQSDQTPHGHIIKLARNTNYGCEAKTHFWLNDCTEEYASSFLEHNIIRWGEFADLLKITIKKFKSMTNKSGIYCKFCYSENVVKNGMRKNGQYWLCKNCGRGFLNNGALSKMKYSFDVITKAVNDYNSGRSLSVIREEVGKTTNSFPSYTTLYGWIKRLTQVA